MPEQVSGAAVPVGDSFVPADERGPALSRLVDRRVIFICFWSVVVALAAAIAAKLLAELIGLITNLSFYGRFSTEMVMPSTVRWGWLVIAVPVVGGLVVGVMARYGSKAIRGHGIPEAMEVVLLNSSRVPARLTWLKPISAAIAIGTGGPFGAEGPIIATGGALGSVVGQLLHTTAWERKTLLAAGAAAGMAATFGTPVSAVLLVVELLLFEFRARSLIPVALAAVTAAAMRRAGDAPWPMFPMPQVDAPTLLAMGVYVALGAAMGLASAGVTKAVYWVEDAFEKLPVHWMWWPAIGAVAVGVVGYFSPRTLGVGYDNITQVLSTQPVAGALGLFVGLKFLSWAISLGSGTSGGTLAPLMTIGGGLGASLGVAAGHLLPWAHVDARVAALVGMAALFAGASRAVLTSVVFAFEATLQPMGLLPLLGGCAAAHLVSCMVMRNTIMTEKIVRRGVRVPAEYAADFLDMVLVRDAATAQVVTLRADQTAGEVRAWIHSEAPGSAHQGYPVVDSAGRLQGVLTRRNLADPSVEASAALATLIRRPATVIYDDCTLRDAADLMARHGVGRLPVVRRAEPGTVAGILTRSDVLMSHRRRLADQESRQVHLRLGGLRRRQ